MHYSFKSTPTWTMKGRPQSNYSLIQLLLMAIQALLIIMLKSHCIDPALYQLSLNQETYLKTFNLSQVRAVINQNLTLQMDLSDQ